MFFAFSDYDISEAGNWAGAPILSVETYVVRKIARFRTSPSFSPSN
jgi:hypothetical protein